MNWYCSLNTSIVKDPDVSREVFRGNTTVSRNMYWCKNISELKTYCFRYYTSSKIIRVIFEQKFAAESPIFRAHSILNELSVLFRELDSNVRNISGPYIDLHIEDPLSWEAIFGIPDRSVETFTYLLNKPPTTGTVICSFVFKFACFLFAVSFWF